jgi:hypothetical protein
MAVCPDLEIVTARPNKKWQMRWNRTIVQPLLDVGIAMLNDTLEAALRRCVDNGRFRSSIASPAGFGRQSIAISGR